MKKSLAEHGITCLRIAPFAAVMTASTIALTLTYRIFPLWFYAIALILGLVFAIFMPRYWIQPSHGAFFVIIAILVGVQQIVYSRFQEEHSFFSLDTWVPVFAFLASVFFIAFTTLFVRRKQIRTILQNRISEQGAVGNEGHHGAD